MSCTREQAVKQMQAWVGLKESDGSHKKIIDIYNTLNPLPRGYKLSYKDPWCAGTISALAVACKATDIIPTECSCAKMIEKAKAMGIWVEKDNHVPKPGDIMMYDWDDSGKGDNTNNPDHVGMVEKIAGNDITVIEGNYSDSVKRRPMAVNGRYIRGYIVPKYAAAAAPEKTETKQDGNKIEIRILSRGCEGEDVRALQILLSGRGYNGNMHKPDGIFGPNTEGAVKLYQKAKGLTVDGDAGPITISSLLGL